MTLLAGSEFHSVIRHRQRKFLVRKGRVRYEAGTAKSTNPFRYFDSSPAVIRLVVMMYVRYPLSLRNVEDLLFERGIDICHETVRHWWHRFGPMFAGEIRRKRVRHIASSHTGDGISTRSMSGSTARCAISGVPSIMKARCWNPLLRGSGTRLLPGRAKITQSRMV